MRVRFDFLDQPHLLQTRDDRLARGKTVRAVHRQRRIEVRRLQHACNEIRIVFQLKLSLDAEDVDLRQVMPPADLEIAEVVRRRDLHGTRTLLRIGNLVADNRNPAPDQRQDCVGPDQRLVAIVLRVHRNGGVAQHRFRPRRGNNNVGRRILRLERFAFQWIAQVPEVALGLHLDHFQIGNRREQLRVPVDQPLVLVDQAFAVQLDEHLHDGLGQALVHANLRERVRLARQQSAATH